MAESLEDKEIERERATAALGEKVEELAHANAELEAFTYSVSHDLKEPLRTLEAFSHFLLDDYSDRLDDQGREYLSKLGSASARMKRLIEDVLALSRIGKTTEPPPAPVDVRRIVLDILEGMRTVIEAREVKVDIAGQLPLVLADALRVEQIFGNLISNGIKFNQSAEPQITVGVRELSDGQTAFFVQDNGIGIDNQYHERIFGIFQRLHRREEYDGTGAGLAIAKRAVETLGGRVWIESEPGAGSTFLFTLPIGGDDQAQKLAAA